jgi:hypothetical protein
VVIFGVPTELTRLVAGFTFSSSFNLLLQVRSLESNCQLYDCWKLNLINFDSLPKRQAESIRKWKFKKKNIAFDMKARTSIFLI